MRQKSSFQGKFRPPESGTGPLRNWTRQQGLLSILLLNSELNHLIVNPPPPSSKTTTKWSDCTSLSSAKSRAYQDGWSDNSILRILGMDQTDSKMQWKKLLEPTTEHGGCLDNIILRILRMRNTIKHFQNQDTITKLKFYNWKIQLEKLRTKSWARRTTWPPRLQRVAGWGSFKTRCLDNELILIDSNWI